MVSVSPLSTRDLVERRELASDSSVHMSSRLYRERERDSNMGPLVCVGHLGLDPGLSLVGLGTRVSRHC